VFDAIPDLIDELHGEPGLLSDAAVALLWAHDEIAQLREDLHGSTGALLSLTEENAALYEDLRQAIQLAVKLAARVWELEEKVEVAA
jgi:hypothetical protein